MFGTKPTNSRRSLFNTAAHLLPLPHKYKLSLISPENFQTNSAVHCCINTSNKQHLYRPAANFSYLQNCKYCVDINTFSSLPPRVTSLLNTNGPFPAAIQMYCTYTHAWPFIQFMNFNAQKWLTLQLYAVYNRCCVTFEYLLL